jgi:hypothetical protein
MNTSCSGSWPNVFAADAHFDADALGYPVQPLYDTRDRGDTWVCPGGGVCGTACATNTCNLTAAANIIYFVPSGWGSIADSNTVALTTNLFIPDTGFIVDSDMEFNDQHFDWRSASAGCSASSATCFDIQTVALHEAGHFLGFNHVMCADAVMFPQGSGTGVEHALSTHETTGLCTIYRPRNQSVADRDTMEQCQLTSECPTSPAHVCIKPAGHDNTSGWGWCAKTCTQTSTCGTGFICATADNGTKFCKPGANGTGGAVVTDPGTGTSLDLCAPCTAGSQCASGICVAEGGPNGVCTQACIGGSLPGGEEGTGDPCPDGMVCVATDQEWSVCWPSSPTSCGNGAFQGVLNELCFLENVANDADDDWYKPCGPDLLCFGFRPRCEGKEGRCVKYCNPATACPDGNTQCCYGVDDLGSCTGPANAASHGGCFDIRRVGETCVSGEQSICEPGAGCFYFSDAATPISRCYPMCTSNGVCEGDNTCVSFNDACDNSFGLCCQTDAWLGQEGCVPSASVEYYDVGVKCRVNEDCDSGLCLKYDGTAACSRSCNPVTGIGCPGDIDVNADGTTDGGFRCLLINGEGRCWPRNGPADPPAGDGEEPPGGCCSSMSASPGDWLLSLVLFAPLWVSRLRRRR